MKRLLVCALFAGACAEAAPEGAPRTLHVLARAAAGQARAPQRPPPLLWLENSAIDPGEDLLHVIPLDAPGPLEFRARFELEGMPPEGGAMFALTLATLGGIPPAGDLQAALALRQEILFQRILREGPGEEIHRVVHPGPGAKAVALVLSLEDRGGRSGAAAGLLEAQLWRADEVALLAASPYALDVVTEPGSQVTGYFALGGTSKQALALLDENEVRIPIDVPAGGGVLALDLGLFPLGPAAAGKATFDVSLERAGERTPLLTREIEAESRKRSTWHAAEVAAQLPAGRGLLVFRCSGARGSGAVPLVGSPVILAAAGGAAPLPNVVLISIDTLRADHVGFLGARSELTPALDALARESLVFERAWTNAPYTLPAHMSLLTGQFPSVHGVVDPSQRASPGRTRLLAEILAERGYATAAFTGGGYMAWCFGFARGFERYGCVDPLLDPASPRIAELIAAAPDVDAESVRADGLGEVIQWLGERKGAPFFLFLHTYAAHEFDPPDEDLLALGYAERSESDSDVRELLSLGAGLAWRSESVQKRRRLHELYAGAVHQADAGVGRVLDALRSLGLFERTLVVVVSDHGKEIGDHDFVGHGHTLYEELLRVPLLVRVPGALPGRVAEPAMLVDIVPTVLAHLDLGLPRGSGGVNLLGPLDAERPLYAEVDAVVAKWALLEGERKTIVTPQGAGSVLEPGAPLEAYDLARDPLERNSFEPAEESVQLLRGMRAALLQEGNALGPPPELHGFSAGLAQELRALGYLGAEPAAARPR